MSQQAIGIEEAVITWAVFAAPINTTITPWDPTTKARGSLLGFLSTEDLTKSADSRLIGLKKQIFGAENDIEMSSGGQTMIASFNLQGVDKYTAKILTNEIGDFTGVVADDSSVGSIKGIANAGYKATPHRFVFIPQYHKADGTLVKISDMDLESAFELPRANVISAYEVTYNSEDYASIDVELKALAGEDHNLYIEGSEISLTVTP